MRTNELQGRCVIARGLAPPDLVKRAFYEAQGGTEDVCGVLLRWRQLSPQAAEAVRQEVRRATSSGEWPQLPVDADATVAAPPRPPVDPDATVVPPPQHTGPTHAAGSRGGPTGGDGPLPNEFGRYVIEGELSRGGMGVIYRAKHRRLGKGVALKVMLNHDAAPEHLARFEREAQVLAKIEHPHVVRVSDFGDERGVPYIAMELIQGRDLKHHVDRLRKRKAYPDAAWVARVLAPIAQALANCHELGVVHRDLKPHNILIEDKTERPVLVDFGLVTPKRVDPESLKDVEEQDLDAGRLTQEGEVLGTPAYMAPEQIVAEAGTVAEPADVWGLGATLFYCLTGEPPFAGSSAINVWKKVLTEPPREVTDLNPAAPRKLRDLCRRCLRSEPGDRPTMRELQAALEGQLNGGRAKLVAIAGAVLVLLAAALGALWFLRPLPELKAVDPLPAWTVDPEVRFGGTTSPGARVFLQEETEPGKWIVREEFTTGEVGEFGWPVQLSEGPHVFRVRVDQASAEPTVIRVGRDVHEPKLTVDGVQRSLVALPTPDALLTGKIEDDSPCTLTLNGEPVEVAADGRFSIRPRAGAAVRVTIVARDAVERTVERTVTVFRHLTPLMERERWQQASPEAQDQAIAEVAAHLGEAFEFVGAEEFECGGLRHRLGVFRHGKSGSLLHLVPGGTYKMGCLDPDAAMQAYLEAARVELPYAEQIGLKEHPGGVKATIGRDAFNGERPVREITVPPFLVGRNELTQGEWARISGKRKKDWRADDHPQAWVDYDEVLAWLEQAGDGLRLPSEAEWEFACRAGAETIFFWGDEPDFSGRYNVYWLSSVRADQKRGRKITGWHMLTRRVSDLPREPNAFGLVDTLGNLWEFCSGQWTGHAKAPADGSPRGSPAAPLRTRLGGGINYAGPSHSRCSARGATKRNESVRATGFRLVRGLGE